MNASSLSSQEFTVLHSFALFFMFSRGKAPSILCGKEWFSQRPLALDIVFTNGFQLEPFKSVFTLIRKQCSNNKHRVSFPANSTPANPDCVCITTFNENYRKVQRKIMSFSDHFFIKLSAVFGKSDYCSKHPDERA